MLCDWRACGYKQSYIRKNTGVGVAVVKAGTLRDTQRGDGHGAVGSAYCVAVGAKCEYKILWTPLLRLKLYALGNYIHDCCSSRPVGFGELIR